MRKICVILAVNGKQSLLSFIWLGDNESSFHLHIVKLKLFCHKMRSKWFSGRPAPGETQAVPWQSWQTKEAFQPKLISLMAEIFINMMIVFYNVGFCPHCRNVRHFKHFISSGQKLLHSDNIYKLQFCLQFEVHFILSKYHLVFKKLYLVFKTNIVYLFQGNGREKRHSIFLWFTKLMDKVTLGMYTKLRKWKKSENLSFSGV